MTYPGPLRHLAVRVAAKVGWLVIGWYVVVRTTPALGASFYFEPTSDALAAERHGQHVVALSCLVLAALAAVAWYLFDPPLWSPIVVGGLAVVLLALSTTEWAYLAIPLPYLVMAGASVGVVAGRRSVPRAASDGPPSPG